MLELCFVTNKTNDDDFPASECGDNDDETTENVMRKLFSSTDHYDSSSDEGEGEDDGSCDLISLDTVVHHQRQLLTPTLKISSIEDYNLEHIESNDALTDQFKGYVEGMTITVTELKAGCLRVNPVVYNLQYVSANTYVQMLSKRCSLPSSFDFFHLTVALDIDLWFQSKTIGSTDKDKRVEIYNSTVWLLLRLIHLMYTHQMWSNVTELTRTAQALAYHYVPEYKLDNNDLVQLAQTWLRKESKSQITAVVRRKGFLGHRMGPIAIGLYMNMCELQADFSLKTYLDQNELDHLTPANKARKTTNCVKFWDLVGRTKCCAGATADIKDWFMSPVAPIDLHMYTHTRTKHNIRSYIFFNS